MQFFTLQQSSKVLETQLFPVLCTECLLTQLSTTTGNPASAQRALFSAQTPSDRKSVPVSAVLGWVLAAFGFVSSSAAQPASAISGIRVIFLYVPLVVFAIMFIILLFYKLDKEYGHIVEDLEKRAKRA